MIIRPCQNVFFNSLDAGSWGIVEVLSISASVIGLLTVGIVTISCSLSVSLRSRLFGIAIDR